MIEGTVSDDLEPSVELTIYGPAGEHERLEFFIDTGFTGAVTLHSAVVAALGLRATGAGRAVLADGSEIVYQSCKGAFLEWDGIRRSVLVAISDNVALLGMAVLEGHELQIRAVPGGLVRITPV